MRTSRLLLLLPWLLLPLLAPQPPIPLLLPHATPTAPTTTVTYHATSALFSTPERGWYHHTETHSANYTTLDLATLQAYRQDEAITLILRVFYLEDFTHSDISPAYLEQMQADFAKVRAAGLKVIVRFAYTAELPETPPYGDASKAQILRHIEQLRPILQANSDVIAVFQAGFIGVWGEWVYTDYFVADPSNPDQVTEQDWANRREVLTALLKVLPITRTVQLRTPLIKQKLLQRTLPLAVAEAQRGSAVARTGHHNDCFLASDTDSGTYTSERITQEQAYLAEETRYLAMGGETCALNPPRSECPTALAELSRFHWSYLNRDYHPKVLDSWEAACFEEVERRLGYRLTLVEGSYADEVQPGGAFPIEIEVRNNGWAAPSNPRLVELVLRHRSSSLLYRVKLPDDPREWLPERGNIVLKHRLCTSSELPPGEYELLLNLPDPEPALYALPMYALRLANELVWEESSGYNDLQHTIRVLEPARNRVPSSSALLAVCDEKVYLPLIVIS